MIEFGLEECASVGLSNQISPTLHSTKLGSDTSDEFMEVCYHDEIKAKNRTVDTAALVSTDLYVNTQVWILY